MKRESLSCIWSIDHGPTRLTERKIAKRLQRERDLKVIGVGFGRTGADSTRAALNLLGFGSTHHMYEVMPDEATKQAWRAKVQRRDVDWDGLLGGFSSCLDWPSVHYWRELVALNPEAYVVLTSRSPESR